MSVRRLAEQMDSQAFRPSPRTTRSPHIEKERQRSDLTRRSDDTSGPLPTLLNRSENRIKKKEKCLDSSIDEAYLILSKHRDLGYIPFLTAGNQIQKDARAQFAGVREDYQFSHPIGLVLTYATLCKYYPDATADKVTKVWQQAVEDWQALGDKTRNLYTSHEYNKWEQLYGRDEKTFDKEKNRRMLMESYLQREKNMRVLATQSYAFDSTAFQDFTFQEAATNDILLNTMFLTHPKSLINEDSDKQEQFQREKKVKYIERKQQQQLSQSEEPDEMDLYLARVEAEAAQRKKRRNPAERHANFAQVGTVLFGRAMQQAAKNTIKNLRPV